MIVKVKLDIPYPKVRVEEKNPYYADLLSEDYAGIKGELTAITQYSYQHMEKFSSNIEFSKIMEEIAKAEMIHLELLGKTIKLLGKDPIYSTCEAFRGDCIMWNSNFVNYSTDLKDMLKIDISSEEAAIKTYTLHKKLIDDKIKVDDKYVNISDYIKADLEKEAFSLIEDITDKMSELITRAKYSVITYYYDELFNRIVDEYLNDKKISEEKIDAIIEILKNYYVGVLFTK